MKVQINARALLAACDRFIARQEVAYADSRKDLIRSHIQDVTTGWWLWRKTAPLMSPEVAARRIQDWENTHRAHNVELVRAQLFLSIAKHKNPNTLLEITDSELDGIAPYLSEFNDPNGRIE